MLKDASNYEIMRPEMVGLKKSSLVLGKHSGRHAFVHKLEEMGYKLGANQLEDAFVRMKALADRKKDIYDEDIEALVDQEIAASHDRIKLASLTVIAGTHGPQRATMKLNIDGQIKIEEAEGNGPVDAVFNCIKLWSRTRPSSSSIRFTPSPRAPTRRPKSRCGWRMKAAR